MTDLLYFFHENKIDCKHCRARCTEAGKDKNTFGVYLDSIWYNGFQCNAHSGFGPHEDLLECLCKYKDLVIKEKENKIEKVKEWVKEHTEADGCMDVSFPEVDKLMEILK